MTRTLHLQPIVPELPSAPGMEVVGALSLTRWELGAPNDHLVTREAPHAPGDILPDGSRCVSCEPKRLGELTKADLDLEHSSVPTELERRYAWHRSGHEAQYPYSPTRWVWLIWSEVTGGDE